MSAAPKVPEMPEMPEKLGLASKPFLVCVGGAVILLGVLSVMRDRGVFDPALSPVMEAPLYEPPARVRSLHFEGYQRVGIPAKEDLQSLRELRRASRRQRREVKRYEQYRR